MATTPIYGFETPDDTDLVKDGALSIRTALDDVDTTLGTALNSNDYAGLVLVKKQTIGTGVSSVSVTGAFSSAYDNYKIIVSTRYSAGGNRIYLRGSSSTGATYRGNFIYMQFSNGTVNGVSVNSASFFDMGLTSANNRTVSTMDLCGVNDAAISTNLSGFTTSDDYNSQFFQVDTANNSSTALTVQPAGGTMTGGAIYVYGYGAS
jgi:hypothetical protein